jgi:O-antigen/teichoic acid export membrane protein
VTLREEAIAGVRWTSIASFVRGVLQFVQLAILARMLTPADFGLMAIVVVVVVFLETFVDLGVSNAIVHHQEADRGRLSSLFWLNVLAGAACTVLAYAASPLLAGFYGEPALRPLLALAALNLLIGSFWQQIRVRAEKDLRFASLAVVEIGASLASVIVSVFIAWRGGGVFSLVGGMLASGLAGALLGWLTLAAGWRPAWRLRVGEVRGYLGFGAYMIGNNVVNSLASQLDVLLGAKLLGAQAIGLYGTSKSLCLQVAANINPIVTRVGLPLMARSQKDRELLRTVYLQTTRMTASVNSPVHVAIAVFAPETVHLLLGPQWDGAIPLVRVLALWALVRSTINPVGSLLMACGRADLSFKWNVAWLLVTAPVVWVASHFGVLALALAVAALIVAALAPSWHFLVRPLCGASLASYAREMAIPMALSLISGMFAYVAAVPLSADLPRLAAGLACGAVAYLVLSRFFNVVWLAAMRELVFRG